MLALYLVSMALVVGLAIASAAGYQHTLLELDTRLTQTIWLVFGLVIFRAVVMRFVLVTQQKLAIRKAKEEKAAREAAAGDASQAGGDSTGVDETALSYEAISEHTRMLLRWVVAFGLIIGSWGIWKDAVPAFSFLNRIELWSYTVQVAADTEASAGEDAPPPPARTEVVPVDLADLILAIILASATIVLATHGPNVLNVLILLRLPIDAGARYAVAALLRYAILILGFILAFDAVGIGWRQVQWLAAAMTVGLAFGLQEIFANFVSGVIILFERPIRIGDVVTVGGVDGKITRISMRATAVTDWNRRELIVPNKTFVTSQIINWTHSDPITRVDVPVGIAYGSNTKLARDLLLKSARECDLVLHEPAPGAIFRGFGDSALDFELRVFIPNRDIWPQMIDELHTRIDDEFRQAGIEIAFPQRDVHVRSVQDVLPIIQGEQRQPSSRMPDTTTVSSSESGHARMGKPNA
jgi:potassium efflux system protein